MTLIKIFGALVRLDTRSNLKVKI